MSGVIRVQCIWPGRWFPGFLILILISAFSFHVRADDDDDDSMFSTNRDRRPIEELFKTDTVYPQEKGELEVEVASLYQNNKDGQTVTVPLSVEYGLTSAWQVEAEWESFVQHSPSQGHVTRGIGDLELGTQYSFLNIEGSLFNVAPIFSIEIPTGDVNKDLSEGFLEYQPSIVLSRDFPELHRTSLFTELGFSLVQRVKRPADADDAEPAAHEFNLGAGFFTLFHHGGALTMEFNWNNNQWNNHGNENEMYITPGWLYRLNRNIELGLGVPVGLNNQSDRFQIAAHVVWEF